MAAICYGLDDFTRTGTFLGSTCSTNTLCKWNAPPPERRVSDMSFQRVTHSSLKILKRTASVRDEHDPRPPAKRNPSRVEETEKFRKLLLTHSAGAVKKPGWLHVLPTPHPEPPAKIQPRPVTVTIPLVRDIVSTVTVGKSSEDFRALCDSVLTQLAVSPQQQHALEYRTRGQSDVQLWHDLRLGRLTSSAFGSIVRRVASPEPLVRRLLDPKLIKTKALAWGRKHEETARKAYVQDQKGKGKDLKVTTSGLQLMPNGYIGCSPDGIIFDPALESHQQRGLLEIKCPYSAIGTPTAAEACKTVKGFAHVLDENNTMTLKRNHDYYYQVQGGMAILEVEWCDFVTWTPNWLSIERIDFQKAEWESKIFPKLKNFYRDWLLPELVQPKHSPTESLPTELARQPRHSPTESPPTELACCASCKFASRELVLRTCSTCAHVFHHMCTTDELGKHCVCCVISKR